MTDISSRHPRLRGFFWVTVSYIVAFIVAILLGYYLYHKGNHPLVVVGVADLAGTGVVFVFSYIFRNTSFYDPYWSVVPPLIALSFLYMGWESAEPVRALLIHILVFFWGIRLTYNWGEGWPGIHHQDWRYADFEQKTGKWFWVVSFFGLHLFPTVMVFLGCLPMYVILSSGEGFGMLDVFAAIFTLGAIVVELIADEQLRTHKRNHRISRATLETGLWAYSRHPNYLGEAGFWWGLYFSALAVSPAFWWTGIGALAISLMFHFVSIPMIEKRMFERRDNYSDVIHRIPRWFFWFPKKQKSNQ